LNYPLRELFRRYDLAEVYEATTTANYKFGPWGWIGENITIVNDDTSDLTVRLTLTKGSQKITVKAGEVWQQDLISVEHIEFITGSIDVRCWVFGHSQ
jgi:hypothetical protein